MARWVNIIILSLICYNFHLLSRVAAQTQQTERHGQLVHLEVFRWLATASMVEADIRAPNDNINFNHQYWCFIKVIFCVDIMVLYKMSIKVKPQFYELSPQIWRKRHPDPQSPWSCLPQLKLEHRPMVLVGSQGKSSLLLQGGEPAQKKSSLMFVLQPPPRPAKGGLG